MDGADPLAAASALGEAIGHVHAKDTRINAAVAAVNGLLDTTPVDQLADRAWSYVTLGRGHDASWWRSFTQSLRKAGYDGVLSIEHEDQSLSPLEGVRESVVVLREALS